MRKSLLVLAAVVAALATAASATAAGSDGAAVVKDAGCTTSFFGTTCMTVKTVTNTTMTPSGKISYVSNGTVEREITFVFGGTYTFTSSIHTHGLRADGELQEESDHYASQWEYVSGTYHLVCVQSFDLHWANGAAQPYNSELYCVPA
jgi:opacity protein-like surface antigen